MMKKVRNPVQAVNEVDRIAGASLAPLPRGLQPQLCFPSPSPPDGDQWLHEIKFDGYRIMSWIDNGKVVLRTRSDLDWTARFRHLVTAIKALGLNSAILDGELVALRPNGASSFDHHNDTTTGYIWTARAEDILEKVRRAREVLNKTPTV